MGGPIGIERVGSTAAPDLDVEGREAFIWLAGERRHHVYISPTTSGELQAQLRFRDRLLADPDLAAEYAARKRALAVRCGHARPAYTDAKTDFITAALRG